jgi:hypothetical protein
MNTKEILQAQVLLGRTYTGRMVNERAMPFVHDTLGDLASSSDSDLIECLNCKFVADTRAFLDGCINCGCKDKDTFAGTDRLVRKREGT